MDGAFVPSITFGADVVQACRNKVDLPFETHLMVERAERHVEAFLAAGCTTVIAHIETTPDIQGRSATG
jgi:ribulose-phosphate 3-epimerase